MANDAAINGYSEEGKYITLISSDGFEYVVLREATEISPTIKSMLRNPFSESRTGRCDFPEIRYAISLPPLLPLICPSPSLSSCCMMTPKLLRCVLYQTKYFTDQRASPSWTACALPTLDLIAVMMLRLGRSFESLVTC